MAVGVAVGAGLLSPRAVLAAWPKAAFEAKDVATAMKGVFGTDLTEASDKITIKAPDIAENGAVVPISVTTDLAAESTVALGGVVVASTLDGRLTDDGVWASQLRVDQPLLIALQDEIDGR